MPSNILPTHPLTRNLTYPPHPSDFPTQVGLITAEDIETVRYACAALCRLCATKENGNLILRSGAVPTLVQRAIKGDSQTQQYCGAVLSSLSFYESCRVQLFEMNIISALKKLAEVGGAINQATPTS